MLSTNKARVEFSSIKHHYFKSQIGRSGEDRYIIATLNDSIQMFAVLDGHGGSEVVDYLKKHLASHLAEKLFGVDMNMWRETIIKSFIEIDQRMKDERLTGGSTAIITLIAGKILYIIILGDSRAVIFDFSGHILIESEDHIPENEIERIKAAGGFVAMGRVNYILATSRAFGDFPLKVINGKYSPRGPVTVIPEVSQCEISQDGMYILLGSDGLFASTTSQDLVNMIVESSNIQYICPMLIKNAISRSNDDVTVILVQL